MPDQAVVNASPLIFLAKAGMIHFLQQAAPQILIPTAVTRKLAPGAGVILLRCGFWPIHSADGQIIGIEVLYMNRRTQQSLGTLATVLAGFRIVVLCADLLAWAFSLLISKITSLKKPASNVHLARR